MLKSLFLLIIGCFGGLWLAWPGLTNKDNLSCAVEIIQKTQDDRTDIRALLAISPRYILKKTNLTALDKLRIMGNACFR